jgi:hypothetical protein
MASGAPMAPVASDSPSGPPSSTNSGANPTTRGPRSSALLAIAVIVVVVVLVVGLLLSGVILHPSSSSGGSTGSALSFSEARNLAEPTGASATGGPWSLFEARAYDTNLTVSSQFAVALTCFGLVTTHYLTTLRPEIPAFNGSLALGLSPFWIFYFSNGTIGPRNETNTLVVVVVNGTAIAFETTATPCTLGVQTPLPVSGLLDSPAALTDALATNASFFVAHPHLNASMGIGVEGRGVGPEWATSFTTCAPFTQFFDSNTTAYPGYSYGVLVNATTGAQLGSSIPEGATCSSFG